MSHTAEFLLGFDPERFIRMGLTDEDFIDLGFTQAELDVVGMHRLTVYHSSIDFNEHSINWWGYRMHIEEDMELDARRQARAAEPKDPAVDTRRVSEPLCFMHVEPDVVNKLINDLHPEWLANGTDFKYQTAKAILWDTGVVEISNITLIRCVGDNPLVQKTMEVSRSFLPYYAMGGVTVVDPWEIGEQRTNAPLGAQPGIDSVLGHSVTVSEDGIKAIVAELSRRSGMVLNPSVFTTEVIGTTQYVMLAKPAPLVGMIIVKHD